MKIAPFQAGLIGLTTDQKAVYARADFGIIGNYGSLNEDGRIEIKGFGPHEGERVGRIIDHIESGLPFGYCFLSEYGNKYQIGSAYITGASLITNTEPVTMEIHGTFNPIQ